MDVGLVAMAHVLPERRVSSVELAERFKDENGQPVISARALERLTGVSERRWAAPDEYSSDLAARATSIALERAGVCASEVDLLIFAAASHDVAEPATANRVQSLLHCEAARVFDVKNACNSFLDGIDIARTLIASGQVSTAVVATGEVISPFVALDLPAGVDPMKMVAGLTLGDAGAAAVLSNGSRPWRAVVEPGVFRSYGQHWDISRIMAGGSMRGRNFDEAYFWSDSGEILGLANELVPQVIAAALENMKWCAPEVDWVVPHQASVRVIESICATSGLRFERCEITARELGNTAAASIPVALSIAMERGLPSGCSRVLLVGGAAGFSAAAVPLAF